VPEASYSVVIKQFAFKLSQKALEKTLHGNLETGKRHWSFVLNERYARNQPEKLNLRSSVFCSIAFEAFLLKRICSSFAQAFLLKRICSSFAQAVLLKRFLPKSFCTSAFWLKFCSSVFAQASLLKRFLLKRLCSSVFA
jgi:hypothetical protein